MKLIKPFRLSVLNRPFRWQRRNRLGLAVLAMTDMSDTPRLYPETELWEIVGRELGGVVDMGMPKPCAEFLVSGNAYTAHQKDKTACAVKVRVDTLEKHLLVFGERYVSDNRVQGPAPFETMPVDWRTAYGGPTFAANPLGRGHDIETVDGIAVRRLPNVESPAHRHKPGAPSMPASFGPLDITWPQRFSRVGQYDQNWLQTDYPGFSDSFDWRFFNMASDDQQWPAGRAFPPRASYEIWNMHPEKASLTGRLPDWRVRCFIDRQVRDEVVTEPVELALSTAWFIPHLERVIMVYHAAIDIQEDDAADVLRLMPTIETAAAPRSDAHYLEVMRQRGDPATGAYYAFREADLLPAEAIGPWLDTEPTQADSPMMRRQQARRERMLAEADARMVAMGLDPHPATDFDHIDLPTKAPKLSELPELRDQMQKAERALRAAGEAAKQAAARDLAALPESTRRLVSDEGSKVTGPPAELKSLGRPDPDLMGLPEGNPVRASYEAERAHPDFAARQAEHEARLRKGYLYSAQFQDGAPRLVAAPAVAMREKVKRLYAASRAFVNEDLTGADLAGLDLRGADFTGAMLENANLSDALLDGSNMTEAVLTRAQLHRTSLVDVVLVRASLALAQAEDANFSGANFSHAQCMALNAQRCNFTASVFEQTFLKDVSIADCVFDEARFDSIAFTDLTIKGTRWQSAQLSKIMFYRCTLDACRFDHAVIDGMALVDVVCNGGVSFSHAQATSLSVSGESTLIAADFNAAHLAQCNFRGVPMTSSTWDRATLDKCDLSSASLVAASLRAIIATDCLFVRTDFTGAALDRADLTSAIMSKACLVGADLRSANLFRADVSLAQIDDTTRLDGAFNKRVKVHPLREVQP
jgi:uncharacterized protein YjbI with pentapeptide repeats